MEKNIYVCVCVCVYLNIYIGLAKKFGGLGCGHCFEAHSLPTTTSFSDIYIYDFPEGSDGKESACNGEIWV